MGSRNCPLVLESRVTIVKYSGLIPWFSRFICTFSFCIMDNERTATFSCNYCTRRITNTYFCQRLFTYITAPSALDYYYNCTKSGSNALLLNLISYTIPQLPLFSPITNPEHFTTFKKTTLLYCQNFHGIGAWTVCGTSVLHCVLPRLDSYVSIYLILSI